MAIRIRVPVPRTSEALPYIVAAAGHIILLLFLFGIVGVSAAPVGGGPTLTVSLAGPSRAGAVAARVPRTTPSAPAPEPKEKPPLRATATPQPKSVAGQLAGATAQPERLPKAEAPAATPAAAPTGAAPAAAESSGGEGPPGPIAGGVAGGLEDVGGSDWYVGLVVNRLQDAWRDRPLLPAGSSSLRTTVSFVIGRDGEVSGVRLDSPSGYTPLDSSVMRAALSLGKLPPLPTVYGKDQLRAQFIFELQPPDEP